MKAGLGTTIAHYGGMLQCYNTTIPSKIYPMTNSIKGGPGFGILSTLASLLYVLESSIYLLAACGRKIKGVKCTILGLMNL